MQGGEGNKNKTERENNLYAVLGVQQNASVDEIRRAYRILARRYHPDVNPGSQQTGKFSAIAKFSEISTAYATLSDEKLRSAYDAERNIASLVSEAQKRTHSRANKNNNSKVQPQKIAIVKSSTRPSDFNAGLSKLLKLSRDFALRLLGAARKENARSLAIVEVSLGIFEALLGCKKSVELADPANGNQLRKISLVIPPGSRSGSILRLKASLSRVTAPHSTKVVSERLEEILIIFRVANHPFIAIENRGVVIDLALTLAESIQGATLILPTFDEPVALKIPAFTSSGQEFRLKGKGVLHSDATRGDLYFRTLIKLPDDNSARSKLALEFSNGVHDYGTRENGIRSYLPPSFSQET